MGLNRLGNRCASRKKIMDCSASRPGGVIWFYFSRTKDNTVAWQQVCAHWRLLGHKAIPTLSKRILCSLLVTVPHLPLRQPPVCFKKLRNGNAYGQVTIIYFYLGRSKQLMIFIQQFIGKWRFLRQKTVPTLCQRIFCSLLIRCHILPPRYASMQIIEFQSIIANTTAPIMLQQMQELQLLQFRI